MQLAILMPNLDHYNYYTFWRTKRYIYIYAQLKNFSVCESRCMVRKWEIKKISKCY